MLVEISGLNTQRGQVMERRTNPEASCRHYRRQPAFQLLPELL